MLKPLHLTLKAPAKTAEQLLLVDAIAQQCGLSKTLIKVVLNQGGCWLTTRQGKRRIRQAKYPLKRNEQVDFYYDPKIQIPKMDQVVNISEEKTWGVWYKPPQVLAQGTLFGDEGSLWRYLEKRKNHPVYMINRIDREAAGMMVFAYSRAMAKELTALQGTEKFRKFYQLICLGIVHAPTTFTAALEGKAAITEVLAASESETPQDAGCSRVEAEIKTGRYHQIRRHFAQSGHPLMGDPRYGQHNKNQQGLQLVAHQLQLQLAHKSYQLQLPNDLLLFPSMINQR